MRVGRRGWEGGKVKGREGKWRDEMKERCIQVSWNGKVTFWTPKISRFFFFFFFFWCWTRID
jgi:hypothetical protein